jgi:formamidopyrimidine-DNA glycosylase
MSRWGSRSPVPELPEVETVARDLRPRLVGATIVGARSTWARTLRTHPPGAFAAEVAGRTVEAVGRRAKMVVIDLSGAAALTIHLKMTGQLFVVPASLPEDPYVRLVLELADGQELRFRDIRKFGRVGLYPRDPATGDLLTEPGGPGVFAGHGPEPLDDAFTLRAFRARLRARKGRLKPLLLDQGFLAGIGNIYADEALWTARLHPLRSAGSLRPSDERRLYAAIRTILAEAVERRGSSIDDYTAPDGDGEMQERLNVYQRTGEPCPRCGRPIRRIVIGARASHFCSWCQRLSAADRKAGRRILATMSRGPAETVRHGPRWTELGGDGTLGLTAAEAGRAAARARTERTKRAAAGRRARARAAMTPTMPTTAPTPSTGAIPASAPSPTRRSGGS